MINKMVARGLLLFSLFLPVWTEAKCHGHFVNPITDICWNCLFPLSIGDVPMMKGDFPDTDNPSLPIQVCPAKPLPRLGLAIGFWEPFAMVDVTATPFCFVNLGGTPLKIGGHYGKGGKNSEGQDSFYYVHWYKYPLIYWLNILMYVGCLQTGDFDLTYLTELDPQWHDDEASLLMNPEAVLFGNAITQGACALDAIKSTWGLPIDHLFWCMGAQGTTYPLTGTVFDQTKSCPSVYFISRTDGF